MIETPRAGEPGIIGIRGIVIHAISEDRPDVPD